MTSLVSFLQRQQNMSSTRRVVLEERASVELVEFLSVKKARDGEEQGRISGSMAWRLARGETRGNAATNGNVEVKYNLPALNLHVFCRNFMYYAHIVCLLPQSGQS